MRPLAHESVVKSRSTAPSGHGSVPTVQQNQNVTRRSEAGSALIEFAGSLVLLAVMFAGIFEIGYSFYAYGTLVTAVRAGARYAASQPRGAGGTSPQRSPSSRPATTSSPAAAMPIRRGPYSSRQDC